MLKFCKNLIFFINLCFIITIVVCTRSLHSTEHPTFVLSFPKGIPTASGNYARNLPLLFCPSRRESQTTIAHLEWDSLREGQNKSRVFRRARTAIANLVWDSLRE